MNRSDEFDRPFTATHWGPAHVSGAPGDPAITPFAGDPRPSALMTGVAAALTGPTRIREPAIRRGWLEGTGQGRGCDDYVACSWDVALDLIAQRLRDTIASHGNSGIFAGSYGWGSAARFHHPQTQLKRFLNTIGGFVDQRQTYSFAAGQVICPHVVGDNRILFGGETTTWPAILDNARIIVLFGGINPGNLQVASGGIVTHTSLDHLVEAARRGIRIISVSPRRDRVEGLDRLEWLPIRPGTDVALMLAVGHWLITRNRADEAFLARYTTGYPQLRAYILGETDGTPKTADWAAELCGLPAATLTELAEALADTPAFLTASWSMQRQEHGEQPLWMLIALAAMLGEIGRPGRGVSFGYGSIGNRGQPKAQVGSPGHSTLRNPTGLFIPVSRFADMLLEPGKTIPFDCGHVTYPAVDLVWWAGGNPFHHHQDLNRLVRAIQRPATVIVTDLHWTATARHADIVLPAASGFERNDITTSPTSAHILASKQQLPPFAAARSEYDALRDLSRRFGTEPVFGEGRTEMEWLRAIYADFLMGTRASFANLPDFDEFWARGLLHLPPDRDDYTLFADFRDDPDGAPLSTPSGRIELYSERIARADIPGFAPHPVWQAPAEWDEATPGALHLLSPQPEHRLHSQLDGQGVSRAAKVQGREPLLIHPEDAAERGIAQGDLVRLSNGRGQALAAASLTADLRRGVVMLATGAWFAPDAQGLDLHGNPNVLTSDRVTSHLSQGPAQQTVLVTVAPWAGPAAMPRIHDAAPVAPAGATG